MLHYYWHRTTTPSKEFLTDHEHHDPHHRYAGRRRALGDGSWRLDPARSSVAFHVRHFYGLMTVKGEFADYESTLDLGATPAVELAIQAATLETKLAKRDEHLRSDDFFDVDHHP